MNLIQKIKHRFKYPKKKHDPENTLDYITLNATFKPNVTIDIHIPRLNGHVDVYTLDASTLTPNTIYTNWNVQAKYNFTYKPSQAKYNKLINLNI